MTTFYSVDAYHRAGSRILSRSFTVQKWRGAEDENDNEDPEASADHDEAEDPDLSQGSIVNSGMDVDNDAGEAALVAEVEQAQPILGDEADSDDEEDSPADVALVPIADMLNARYGASKVCLNALLSIPELTES
jgi:SET domain-containing protein 6